MKKRFKIYKTTFYTIIILSILLYKGTFINLFSNLRSILNKPSDKYTAEINILKDNVDYLSKELELLKDDFSDKKYKYNLTKVSYFDPYNDGIFYIYNGKNKNYKKNDILKTKDGVIGIINKVYEDYSECILLTSVKNLNVVINNAYGILSDYKDGYFIINNISNYDDISLNDKVYTSPKSENHEKVLIGYVHKIIEKDIEKIVYIKSDVEFNNINYLYVIGDL